MAARKAIFITGGASGIGQATARLFAERGWRVGLADVNEAGMAQTLAMLAGVGHSAHQLDVRDRARWRAALGAFAPDGTLDVLFNNAGVPMGGAFAAVDFDELDRTIAINLVGAMNGARIGYDWLARTPGSCLLNTASASAIYGSAGLATYSVTKFGVRALTEALDGEWAAAGVRVRAIVPAFIDTPLLRNTVSNSNQSIREVVTQQGLEITSADTVAQAAWDAVRGERLLTYVGATARKMAFGARWLPSMLRRKARARMTP